MWQNRFPLIVVVCLLISSPVAFAQPEYTVVDLGTFQAQRVRDGGLVLGSQNGQPATWQDGVVTILPDLGFGGHVYDSNIHEELVGSVGTATWAISAYWYQGVLFPLPPLVDGFSSWATGINDESTLSGASLQPNQPAGGVQLWWRAYADGDQERERSENRYKMTGHLHDASQRGPAATRRFRKSASDA